MSNKQRGDADQVEKAQGAKCGSYGAPVRRYICVEML